MRVLVCGGRDYGDYLRLKDILDDVAREYSIHYNPDDNWLPTDITIISGKAKGADQMAIDWAVVNYASFEEYPAQWEIYGRRAGPIRNQQMLEEGKPDLVIAFPGGTGTAHMVKISKKAGIPVREVYYD